MTPTNQLLEEWLLFDRSPLKLFRLARTRYANLSGLGAAVAPGRWNLVGEEAIYTSLEVSTPVLERLVHTSKKLIPSNLALMTTEVSGHWIPLDSGLLRDPATGATMQVCRSLDQARLLQESSPRGFSYGRNNLLAVALPSVIVPAWNVVLFPRSLGFWKHVSLRSVEPFNFDPRLFPEEALHETEIELP